MIGRAERSLNTPVDDLAEPRPSNISQSPFLGTCFVRWHSASLFYGCGTTLKKRQYGIPHFLCRSRPWRQAPRARLGGSAAPVRLDRRRLRRWKAICLVYDPWLSFYSLFIPDQVRAIMKFDPATGEGLRSTIRGNRNRRPSATGGTVLVLSLIRSSIRASVRATSPRDDFGVDRIRDRLFHHLTGHYPATASSATKTRISSNWAWSPTTTDLNSADEFWWRQRRDLPIMGYGASEN